MTIDEAIKQIPPGWLTWGLYLWACGEHRAEVERQFTAGVKQPRQLAPF